MHVHIKSKGLNSQSNAIKITHYAVARKKPFTVLPRKTMQEESLTHQSSVLKWPSERDPVDLLLSSPRSSISPSIINREGKSRKDRVWPCNCSKSS